VIDKDAAHRGGGRAEEMSAVLPTWRPCTRQPQISFVDQRCRLQGVTGSLAAHLSGSEPLQFGVDNLKKSRLGAGIGPAFQQ
jgi:hypothetical protein